MNYDNFQFELRVPQEVGGYEISDGCIRKIGKSKNTEIADFYTAVNGVMRFIGNEATVFDISFYCIVEMEERMVCRRSFTVEELSQIKFEQLQYRLTLKPYPRARNDLIYFIQSQAKNAPVENLWYVDKLGDNVLGDEHVYCAGNEILPMSLHQQDYYIKPDLRQKYRFDYDPKMTVKQAIEGIFDYIDIAPSKTALIMAYSLVAVLRAPFKQAGIPPNTTLLLVGDTQTHKTSAVTLSNNMYNRLTNMKFNTTRVDSSLAYLENMLFSFSETSANLDDVFRDPQNYREIEAVSRAVIRENADDSPRNTMLGEKQINAQVAITAEYILKNVTDIGRVILLILLEPLDSERLYKCQKNVLAISTFLRFFISWVYSDFNRIVDGIKEDFIELRQWQVKNASRYSRLDEYRMILNTTYSLFLEFAVSKEYLTDDEAKIKFSEFYGYTDHWKKVQIMVLDKIAADTELNKVNYAQAIIQLIESNIIQIDEFPCEDSVCFEGLARNVHCPGKSPCLFIRAEYLQQNLNYFFHQSKSRNFYMKYLSQKCLLSYDSDCNERKRFGKRYLAINIDLLKTEAKSEKSKIEHFFR